MVVEARAFGEAQSSSCSELEPSRTPLPSTSVWRDSTHVAALDFPPRYRNRIALAEHSSYPPCCTTTETVPHNCVRLPPAFCFIARDIVRAYLRRRGAAQAGRLLEAWGVRLTSRVRMEENQLPGKHARGVLSHFTGDTARETRIHLCEVARPRKYGYSSERLRMNGRVWHFGEN